MPHPSPVFRPSCRSETWQEMPLQIMRVIEAVAAAGVTGPAGLPP